MKKKESTVNELLQKNIIKSI